MSKLLYSGSEALPNICGNESRIEKIIRERSSEPVFRIEGGIDFSKIKSAAAIALHMHQPLIPAGGDEIRTARTISNLQFMMEHQEIGDNHNAPAFLGCYKRMGEIVPALIEEGKNPRVMLDYSGTLLWGLQQMGADDVLESLRNLTNNQKYRHGVEWLGSPWGHAVAPSTPVQDFRLHVKAWQHHFASLFGDEALSRVRGFSPAEMALPNHPDLAYEFVKTLKECGYTWVLLQEHTVENPATGEGVHSPHIPHRLVCTAADGRSESITAIIKTQGSDTKLVAQMQPYYEAKSTAIHELGGIAVPPLVTQIADGENGGVMMNEFPPKYADVVEEASWSDTPLMHVSEYLEHLSAAGIREDQFPTLQPLFQKAIWDRFSPGDSRAKLDAVIDELKHENSAFHMDGGSWTSDISWIEGYNSVLQPMQEASSLFYQNVLSQGVASDTQAYRNALFHLMCAETSCFRYWGEGVWTDYGREFIRRTIEIERNDF